MPLYDTTGHLLPSLRQRAFVPSSNATFKPPDSLRLMTEVLHSRIVPVMLKVREEYYVQTQDVAINTNQAEYVIPARAAGGELRDVLVVAASGVTRNLYEMDPEKMVGLNLQQGQPSQFIMRDNSVQLNPVPTGPGEFLRFVYHRWPSYLIETSASAKVTGISGNVITCAGGLPTAIPFTTGTLLDAIASLPPFPHRGVDLIVTALGATTVTLAAAPTGIIVGDYLCLAGEAPVAQIPYAAYPLLVEGTAGEQMRAVGDLQRSQASDTLFEQKKKDFLSVIGPRIKGEVRHASNGMDKWRGPSFRPGGWFF